MNYFIVVLILLFIAEEEFLPTTRPTLNYWRINTEQFKSETKTEIKLLKLPNLLPQELHLLPAATAAKTGSTFRQVIESVPIEGRFEVLESYVQLSDNYIRSVERTIRSNIFPPIIARTIQRSCTVSVSFLVARDGTIEAIQKETSTGSAALDATAVNACRSSSPLPPAEINTNATYLMKMRFTLTFNP
ncbi:MAG: TonB family protein [Acidobacteriota bacterium]|nr:TonB C-terminal domain-containing protein [Blastocatellia bacterium]MDW8413336.1 TonB family protein [Acidobacteriota bacterium]